MILHRRKPKMDKAEGTAAQSRSFWTGRLEPDGRWMDSSFIYACVRIENLLGQQAAKG